MEKLKKIAKVWGILALFMLVSSFMVDEKNDIASQLSEDERMLQADNDWLGAVKDQLARIERG